MKQPINIQIKTELSTRKRLNPPTWREILVFKAMAGYRLFSSGIDKLKKRLDLNKFLREQKMTNLALRGLLSHSQHIFCVRQG